MKKVILKKISLEISRGIDTEPKVLYFLAEIRKCLDRQDLEIRKRYPNIYFFCNWALHIKMDRTPAKEILRRFESTIKAQDSLKEISNTFISEEVNFYMFIDLKRELRAFFKQYHLSSDSLMKTSNWSVFWQLLVEILKDCPLVNEKGKVSKFSFIEGPDRQIRFRVHVRGKGSFKITLKDVTKKFIKK